MPYKIHTTSRDKIPKTRFRVTNWRDDNESLRRRGDVTVWLDEAVVHQWSAPHHGTRGRPDR
ncbi:MAG TPA: hypothetical protein VKA94_00885 [Hyphomicrobiales bacterium]|nr:hypothetical protein [Hyphomicrobiales bacterium]